jgi:hypothetical protein
MDLILSQFWKIVKKKKNDTKNTIILFFIALDFFLIYENLGWKRFQPRYFYLHLVAPANIDPPITAAVLFQRPPLLKYP